MKRTRRFIAALIAVGFAAAPFAASAQTSATGTSTNMSGSSGAPATTYGSSGQTVGTVTAPSVGTFNQPSVGVTNSVPNWNNTNPRAK
ncbi:hypothetical protein [Bradyrhizobium sp. McL0616]|uniref:hypothetical protein n=1 Tax=Bradyrhizobium sp. McL0616 TaxID=3415674 RepID=UPI003CEC84A3